jgi:hypothetical protein
VDHNGKWVKELGHQPRPFLVNVKPADIYKVFYMYRLGSIRENYEYDENVKNAHSIIKKVL